MDEARLRGIPLFAGLGKKERREVAKQADEVDVEAGRHLVREGEFAYEFFAIEEGTADVRRGAQLLESLQRGAQLRTGLGHPPGAPQPLGGAARRDH
jgi:CRP-like cAMP-binding protein